MYLFVKSLIRCITVTFLIILTGCPAGTGLESTPTPTPTTSPTNTSISKDVKISLLLEGISISTFEDQPLDINLNLALEKAKIEDPELTFKVVTNPILGILTWDDSGKIVYTPNQNAYGVDKFTFKAISEKKESSLTTVEIVIKAEQDKPKAVPQKFATNEDRELLDFLNYENVDQVPASIKISKNPSKGNVVLTDAIEGKFSYMPKLDVFGQDSFEYVVIDEKGASSSPAKVTIEIKPQPDKPILLTQLKQTLDEDTSLSLDLNVTNPDFADLELVVVNYPWRGTVSYDSKQLKLVYVPSPNLCGVDNLALRFKNPAEPDFSSELYTFEFNVNCVVDQIMAQNLSFSVNEDAPSYVGNVVVTNPDYAALQYTVIEGPKHGTFVLSMYNSNFTYTPTADYFGTDQVRYKVLNRWYPNIVSEAVIDINVKSVNDSPVAQAVTVSGEEDTVITGQLMATDKEDANLSYIFNYSSGGGSFSLSPEGAPGFEFRPTKDFNGTVQGTYEVKDSQGARTSAYITVNVNAVSDMPTLNSFNFQNAYGNPVTSVSNYIRNIDGYFTDPDKKGIGSVTIHTQPTKGTVEYVYTNTQNSSDGGKTWYPVVSHNLLYKTNPGAVGNDSFTWSITGKNAPEYTSNIATVSIVNINQQPQIQIDGVINTVASPVLNRDVDEDGTLVMNLVALDPEDDTFTFQEPSPLPSKGTVTLVGTGKNTAKVTYTPNKDYNGTDTFTLYGWGYPHGVKIGTVNINILPVEDAPVAKGGTLVTNEDIWSADFTLAASDAENNISKYAITKFPEHGVLSFIKGNTTPYVSYKPDANYFGTDTFSYTVEDVSGAKSNEGTYNVTVNPINDPPLLTITEFVVVEDTPLVGQLPMVDVDNDPVTYKQTSYPINGYFEMIANGAFTYTPKANYSGSELINIEARDSKSLVKNYTLKFTIQEVDDLPSVEPITTLSCTEDLSCSRYVFAYDADWNAPALQYEVLSTPNSGKMSFSLGDFYNTLPGGAKRNLFYLSYVPNQNFFGVDSARIKFTDKQGNTAETLVTFIVSQVNDMPVYRGETSIKLDEDSTLDFDLKYEDPENDVLTYSLHYDGCTNLGASVSWKDINNGKLFVAPNKDYYGSCVITVIANDGLANVYNDLTVIVNSILDPPVVQPNINLATTAGVAKSFNLFVSSIEKTAPVFAVVITGEPAIGTAETKKHPYYENTFLLNYFPPDSTSSIQTAELEYAARLADGTETKGKVSITVYPESVSVPTVKGAATTNETICALMTDGKVECWGYASSGALGIAPINYGFAPATDSRLNPYLRVNLGEGKKAEAIWGGGNSYCVKIESENLLKCWGSIANGINYKKSLTIIKEISIDPANSIEMMSISYDYACALLKDGTVRCFGKNQTGILGLEHRNDVPFPSSLVDLIPVKLGTNIKAKNISAGSSMACAVTTNGQLKCWGNGILGTADMKSYGGEANTMGDNLPYVNFGTDLLASQITVGYNHSCILLTTGKVKCYGEGYYGALGYEDYLSRGFKTSEMGDNLPLVNLGTNENVIALSAGTNHSCALFDNNKVKCWGRIYSSLSGGAWAGNTSGTMGDSLPYYTFPENNPIAKIISSSNANACAVSNTQQLNCWGEKNAVLSGNLYNVGPSEQYIPISAARSSLTTLRIEAPSSVVWGKETQLRAFAKIDGNEIEVTSVATWISNNYNNPFLTSGPGKLLIKEQYGLYDVIVLYEDMTAYAVVDVQDPRVVLDVSLTPSTLKADEWKVINPYAVLEGNNSKSCSNDLAGFEVKVSGANASVQNFYGSIYVMPRKEGVLTVDVTCYGITKSFSLPVTNANSDIDGKQFAFVTDQVSPKFGSLESADSICENSISKIYGFKNKNWKALLLEPDKTLESRGIKLFGTALFDMKMQPIFSVVSTNWSQVTSIAPLRPILTVAGQSYHGYVWTGLERNATAAQNSCNKWSQLYSEESDSPRGAVGIADDLGTPGGWANAGTLTCAPNAAAIYCISQ